MCCAYIYLGLGGALGIKAPTDNHYLVFVGTRRCLAYRPPKWGHPGYRGVALAAIAPSVTRNEAIWEAILDLRTVPFPHSSQRAQSAEAGVSAGCSELEAPEEGLSWSWAFSGVALDVLSGQLGWFFVCPRQAIPLAVVMM